MPLDSLSINGEPYRIVDQSRIGTRRRSYTETMRPSQPSEARLNTKTWKLSGPIGNSRQPAFGAPLGADYTINLDGRNDGLLTSAAARTAVSLTAVTNFTYLNPDSDVQKTNWVEGAGNGNGSAFDELNEGGVTNGSPGTVDDGTYWETTTNEAELILGMEDPATTPISSEANRAQFGVSFGNTTGSYTVRYRLYQTATVIWEVTSTTISFAPFAEAAFTIPASAVDQITDFTALRMGIARMTGTGTFQVSTEELRFYDPDGGNVITIDEDRGQLFAQRGSHSTQINPPDMTEAQDVDHEATVTGSVASWRGNGIVALGTTAAEERTAVVAATSATYTTIASFDADQIAAGPDRLWISDASDGQVKYVTSDLAVTAANLSNGILVADTNSGTITGLYTLGELMVAGTQRGPRSFTDAGSPAILGEAVKDFPSSLNGSDGDSLWGWHYHGTKLGLYAISPDGRIENPAGPGEGTSGRRFEGPITGFPTAIKAFKDSLWVAYRNFEGNTYLLRGDFNEEFTATTGRPDWYVVRELFGKDCQAIGATTGRTVPTVVWGEDADIAYSDLAFQGREISDTTNYTYNTSGGSWFGTTLMMPLGLIGNVRWAKFFTENMATGENFWALTFDINDSGSFTQIDTSTSSNGLVTMYPFTSTTLAAFNTLKPKFTQIATASDASTSPPQIRGNLTVAFDERPEHVREISVLIEQEQDGQLATLQALADAGQDAPVALRLPTDTAVNTNRFVYVMSAEMEDITDSTDPGIRLLLLEWALD